MEGTPRTQTSVRSRLHAKVTLLEEWARTGHLPEGIVLPTGPVALARWRDAALKLEAWTSPNVAAPNGPNADLRVRADAALKRLAAAQGGSSSTSAALSREREINKSLSAQVVRLSEELQVATSAMRRTAHLLALERERYAALVAQSNKISSIKAAE